MAGDERGGHGGNPGGIAELCQLIEEHGAALEYDLLTMTGYQLRDVGGALSWGALLHFAMHLPRTSALSRELVPLADEERWTDGTLVAPLVADLIDAVNAVGSALMAKGTGRMPRHVRPYPRPWADDGTVTIGGADSAIPIADFEEWWDSKGRKGDGDAQG